MNAAVKPALARREIGSTGIRVTELGFGGAGIGNLYRQVTDPDAAAALSSSLSAGVRYFDTAPFYGFGLSELRMGAVLRAASDVPVISTKVGRRLVPTQVHDPAVGREGYFSPQPYAPIFDYSYESVMESHAQSLQRLGMPGVDIQLCHDIGRMTHGGRHEERLREFIEGGYRAMHELKRSGAVRAIGLGVNEWEVCVELLAHCEFDCIMLAGRYTLLEQPALDVLLPLCLKRNVSILCAGPFNSGILAVGSRGAASSHYNYAPPPAAVLEKVRRLEECCAEFDVPLQAAALQFPLGHPAVAAVVAGCANGNEATRVAQMLRHLIPVEFWLSLRERGLVNAAAPLPGISS